MLGNTHLSSFSNNNSLCSVITSLQVKDNEALTIDRDAKIESVLFDREEYLFKASLYYKDAKRIKFLME